MYQGQEQHFKGNSTPFNREPLWDSGYNKSAPMYVLTSTLNKLRNHAIKLSPDYLESPSEVMLADTNHYCQKKGPSGNQVVFCINNKSSKGDGYQLPVNGFEANDEVVEVLGCTTVTASVDGSITAYMYDGEPRVYTKASTLEGTGLCPERKASGPKQSGAASFGAVTGRLMAVGVAWLLLL